LLDASADTSELLTAIESIARGVPYVSSRLVLGESKRRSAGMESLTPREAQVADLLARKVPYREICGALSIRPGTLKSHVKKIYRKLSVHSRGEAVFEATQLGLLK
jgi:DNA-binding NarL/FixJ family response regulator